MAELAEQKEKLSKRLQSIKEVLSKDYVAEAGWFPDAEPYPNGKAVVDVALLQEYGGVSEQGFTVPPRPFVRPTFAALKSEGVGGATIIKAIMTGDRGAVLGVMSSLANLVKWDLVRTIRNIYDPPLAPMTIEKRRAARKMARKTRQWGGRAQVFAGSLTKPLIDTGHMIQSIEARSYAK